MDVGARDLASDAPARTARYDEYEWWAERDEDEVRSALAETEVAVGLGERLLRAVLDHPDLRSVDGLSLLCRRGLVPFYESVGFSRSAPSSRSPKGDRGPRQDDVRARGVSGPRR